MSTQELEEFLERKADDIGEHFDAVQILASFTDGNGTHFLKRGSGNWYARQGMAAEFIQSDKSSVAAEFIADKLKTDE